MVEGYVANLLANCEGDGDIVVQRCLVVDLADVAMELTMQALKAAEALDNAGALLAEQLPVHFEEAKRGGVQEEIDALGLLQVLLAGKKSRG